MGGLSGVLVFGSYATLEEACVEYYSSRGLVVHLEGENARIFEGSSLEFSELFDIAKWRLCSWLCANNEFRDYKVGDLWLSLEGCLGSSPLRRKPSVVWASPSFGS